MNMQNYKDQKQITIHLLVKGALDHFKQRKRIRHKFEQISNNNNKYQIKVHFLVGKDLEQTQGIRNISVPDQITKEIEMFDDIIVGNFIDTYENLVYKSLMGLEWFIQQASSNKADKFLMLLDDDVDLKVSELYKLIDQRLIHNQNNQEQLLCPWKNAQRARVSRRGPWGVPISTYPSSHWPSYCGGACYLMNFQAAEKLYQSALKIRSFDVKVEDAFMTGILRERASFDLEPVSPICVHRVEKDSVTGRFIEDQNIKRKM